MSKEDSIFNILSFFKQDKKRVEPGYYLIAGLGNPGREYKYNRHNIGFMVLDEFAREVGETFSRVEKNALISKSNFHGKHLVLAKPQNYMNRSGQVVSGLINFYKIPFERIMIIYDDIDLPLGQLRIRPFGGSGGHKGISSIIDHLGSNQFPRMRLGIGRPPGKKEAADYVLKDFANSEKDVLEIILVRAVEALNEYLADGIEAAMNKFNRSEEF